MLAHLHHNAYFCPTCAAELSLRGKGRRLKAMDCPMHCMRCGVFLENPLTPVGRAFVLSLCRRDPDELVDSVRVAAATWKRFYFCS